MKSDRWPKVPLVDISTKIGSGATPRGGKNSYIARGISLIRSLNVYDFKFETEGLAFIDDIQANGLSNVEVEQNDILLNITGASVARCCIVPKKVLPARVNQHVSIVRISPNLADAHYVLNVINSPRYKTQLLTIAQGGATREALTKEKIEQFKIPLPPLPTQRKIASILSAYDDLIENNTRRIQILEEMAQILYRHWFVDYKFPGHEDVRLVDSGTELGMVPEGWEILPFSKLVNINPHLTVDKRVQKPYVGMNALPTNSMVIDLGLIEVKTGNSGAKFQNRDVLFPRITPSVENGKAGFVQFLDEGQISIGSTEIIVFRENELNPEYIYFLSREHNFRENAIKSMVGASGRQRVQSGCFDTYLLAKPPRELLEKFARTVSPMFVIIHTLTKKNANLRTTRDLLLPKLVSGELDVSELEIAGA